jgi:hypothetical protein
MQAENSRGLCISCFLPAHPLVFIGHLQKPSLKLNLIRNLARRLYFYFLAVPASKQTL